MKHLTLFICVLVLFEVNSLPQNQTLPISDCSTSKAEIGYDSSKCVKPVIIGKKDDGFPNKMKIKGVVTKVTLVPVSCGVLCHFGTAEIKLLNKPKGYDSDFIYVTVQCVGGKKEDFLNRKVEIKVLKTDEKRFKYYCGGVYNFIDSNGLPFYEILDAKNRINGSLKVI